MRASGSNSVRVENVFVPEHHVGYLSAALGGDPATHADAKRLDEVSYMDFISNELGVMDATAVTMSKEHGVPIVVFDMTVPGNIVKAVSGEKIGTVIH